MAIFNLPIIGNSFLLSTVLTSLIVGFILLILSEKRKKGDNENGDEPLAKLKSKSKEAVSESDSTALASKVENVEEEAAEGGGAKADSSSCCSGSEEEGGEKKKLDKKKKKHSCEGAKACSSKKTVSDVVLLAAEDEQSKTYTEELAKRLVTGGLSCSTRHLWDDTEQNLKFIDGGPTLLNLFLISSTEVVDELLNALFNHTKDDGNFIYSVVCLAESRTDLIVETAERLNTELAEKGGTEWLPPSCISTSEDLLDSEIITPQKYTAKVLTKVKKISKKCCGTTCGSQKSVDIEDLAASLLPAITPVKT